MSSTNKCFRCDKTVYPIEELKCLDKIWHKGCFKCQVCGMVLNLKSYKGYDKMPYCNAHIPQVKYTAVADTPEARRLAENTRIQSNIKYHQDYEKLKGKVTQIADDPETLRIRNTSKIISNVAYHGELEKKKQMEEKRSLLPDGNGVEEVYDNQAVDCCPQMKTNNQSHGFSGNKSRMVPGGLNHKIQTQNINPTKVENYQGSGYDKEVSPYSAKMQSTVIYTSDQGPVNETQVRKVGSIVDYDPINDSYGSIAVGSDQRIYNSVSSLPSSNTSNRRGLSFRAIYDYKAQDVDEISFLDGDLITNCHSICDGWMTGTVQRTGQNGMLPANYVEPY